MDLKVNTLKSFNEKLEIILKEIEKLVNQNLRNSSQIKGARENTDILKRQHRKKKLRS